MSLLLLTKWAAELPDDVLLETKSIFFPSQNFSNLQSFLFLGQVQNSIINAFLAFDALV